MWSGQLRQYVASFVSQLAVFVSGVAYSSFEPVTIRLTEDPLLSLTSKDVSWLVALIDVGCFLSPPISGRLSDRVGRKYVILSIGPLCFLGWALILISKSMLSLAFVRIILGLTVGIAYTVNPIYTAEIAEPKLRGRLTGSFQTAWYLGVLFAFCTGPYLNYNTFVYVCLPLPVIFVIAFWYMPETPYYLLMSEREEEARKVLKWFRDGSDVEEELKNMLVAVREQMSQKSSWSLLITDKVERKAFIIVQIVCTAKFLSGTPVIANYALETFSMTESFLPPEVMSIILAALLTAIAVVSAFMSDWIGRKPLLLLSCFGCFFSHLLIGGYYYLNEKTSINATPYIWFMYLGIAIYCFFSDIGLGSLLQTLQSEMFGASTRGVAAGIIEGYAAILAFIVLLAYRPVNDTYGVYVNFWFYGVVSLVSGLLLIWLMYETSGKIIGQMDQQPREGSSQLNM